MDSGICHRLRRSQNSCSDSTPLSSAKGITPPDTCSSQWARAGPAGDCVRRRQNLNIRLQNLLATDSGDLLSFQNSQQIDLAFRRDLRHFVQK